VKRWWWLIVAAAGALLAALRGRSGPWKRRATETMVRAEAAGQQAIRERTAVAEQEVANDLADTRSRPGDERLDGALARARRRRAGDQGASAGGS
jgi:hypothetical protein